jgi:NTE family protein
MTENMSLGVALGGGAARGLAHIVILETLDEMGIIPDLH